MVFIVLLFVIVMFSVFLFVVFKSIESLFIFVSVLDGIMGVFNFLVVVWSFWDVFNGEVVLKWEKIVVFGIVVIFMLSGSVIILIVILYFMVKDYFEKFVEFIVILVFSFMCYFFFVFV